MKTKILEVYRKLRANPVSMLVGRDAEMALRDARAIVRFHELEADGVVRLRSEDEEENYFDICGRDSDARWQKEMERKLERLGCRYVLTEWFDGSEWRHADAVGMCVYEDAESPFQNCCVSELMRSAVEAFENHAASEARETAERSHWEARDTVTI